MVCMRLDPKTGVMLLSKLVMERDSDIESFVSLGLVMTLLSFFL